MAKNLETFLPFFNRSLNNSGTIHKLRNAKRRRGGASGFVKDIRGICMVLCNERTEVGMGLNWAT